VRLLRQPSNCMAIFVIFVLLLSGNKYDDDDDDDDDTPVERRWVLISCTLAFEPVGG